MKGLLNAGVALASGSKRVIGMKSVSNFYKLRKAETRNRLIDNNIKVRLLVSRLASTLATATRADSGART